MKIAHKPNNHRTLIAVDMFENGSHVSQIAFVLRTTAEEIISLLRAEYDHGTVGDYYLNRAEMEAA